MSCKECDKFLELWIRKGILELKNIYNIIPRSVDKQQVMAVQWNTVQ